MVEWLVSKGERGRRDHLGQDFVLTTIHGKTLKDFKQESVTGAVLREIIPVIAKTQNCLRTKSKKE